MVKHTVILMAGILFATPAGAADRFAGRADFIPDGDTIHLSGGQKVRLWGIDAPERKTVAGIRSRAYLIRLIAGGTVTCRKIEVDKYNRIVARCASSSVRDLGGAMVRAGWAVDYRFFSRGYYSGAQAAAKAAGIGIWRR